MNLIVNMYCRKGWHQEIYEQALFKYANSLFELKNKLILSITFTWDSNFVAFDVNVLCLIHCNTTA